MARKKEKEEASYFQMDYDGVLDKLEKSWGIHSSVMDTGAVRSSYMSTGLLMPDLVLGGGLLPGRWYTAFGPEGSAKSTFVQHVLISAAHNKIPIIAHWDFEGSFNIKYFEGFTDYYGYGLTIGDIFGEKDVKGKTVKRGLVRPYTGSIGDQFFNAMSSLARSLPSRSYLDGQWFNVFDNTKANISMLKGKYSSALYSSTGKLYVEAENGLPQVVLLLDSYPAMYPERLDKDDAGAGMAAVARMFSENIPKIAGKLLEKGITILGVNQVRQRPAVMYGSPEYEPGGEAVKFVSSCRIRHAARSVPHGKGQIEEEPCVWTDNGTDEYKYIHCRITKNKTYTPSLEYWQRVWQKDAWGNGHGFCPAWDCYQYLLSTGQASGSLKKLSLDTTFGVKTEKPISFYDFKAMIYLNGKERQEWAQELGFDKKITKLRENCFKQIQKGEAHSMLFTLPEDAGEGEDDEEYEDEE